MNRLFLVLGVFLFALSLAGGTVAQPIIADYQAANAFEEIPPQWLNTVRDYFGTQWPPQIFLGTRSHGSQLLYGLGILEGMEASLYLRPMVQQQTGLAGQYEEGVYWTDATRQYLQANPQTKMVIWAMCRLITGVLTEEEINQYLTDMSQLESEYPEVFFVYFNDFLDVYGSNALVEQRNELIRYFCRNNNKILYDFADITAYSPDGYYHAGTDEGGCTWCTDWCLNNGFSFCESCTGCPHSVCFDCYRKGQAFWWLLAKLVGWDPTPTEPESLGKLKSYYR